MTATMGFKVFDSSGGQVPCGVIVIYSNDSTFTTRLTTTIEGAYLDDAHLIPDPSKDTYKYVDVPSDESLVVFAYIDRAFTVPEENGGVISNDRLHPCDYGYCHSVYEGSFNFSTGRVYKKDIHLSMLPVDIEMGYEDIRINGMKPVTITKGMTLPAGSACHFLWGVGSFGSGTRTVSAIVHANIDTWDSTSTLWSQSYEASVSLSPLDDKDLGPIDFNLPAGVEGWLNLKFSFSGIDNGSITYDNSLMGKTEGFKIPIGVDPTPPHRTGTGEAQQFGWNFNGGADNSFTCKPGDVLNSSVYIRCYVRQGDPDGQQLTRFWAALSAKDMNGVEYWKYLKIAPSNLSWTPPWSEISADGGCNLNFSYKLPANLLPGTLTVSYGGDCINRWANFPGYNPCQNLLYNPGFEAVKTSDGNTSPACPDMWTRTSGGQVVFCHRDTTYKKEGLAGVSGIFNTPTVIGLEANRVVKPNTRYRLGGWVMVEPGMIGNTYLDLNDVVGDIGVGAIVKDGQWHYVEGIYTASSTTYLVGVRIVCDSNTGNTKRVSWDNIIFMPEDGNDGQYCDPATTTKIGGFSAIKQDNATFTYTVTACTSKVESFTPTKTSVIPGETVHFDIDVKNKGNRSGLLACNIDVFDFNNNLLMSTPIHTDNIAKAPENSLLMTFDYGIPSNYKGTSIRFKATSYHQDV